MRESSRADFSFTRSSLSRLELYDCRGISGEGIRALVLANALRPRPLTVQSYYAMSMAPVCMRACVYVLYCARMALGSACFLQIAVAGDA